MVTCGHPWRRSEPLTERQLGLRASSGWGTDSHSQAMQRDCETWCSLDYRPESVTGGREQKLTRDDRAGFVVPDRAAGGMKMPAVEAIVVG